MTETGVSESMVRLVMEMSAAFLAVAVLLICPHSALGGTMSELPVITPAYVGFAPSVDGKLGDEAWSRAPLATDFQLLGSAGPATQQTRVRVCYDRNNIYLMFECLEDRMGDLLVKHKEDSAPVWQDDSVEVFICPYAVAGESRCHQFVVNAAGAKAYLRPGWVKQAENWRAAASRQSDRWIVEMAIPFDILKPLGRNENCWRVNFGRNEHPHQETSSWSAVPRWFRTYSNFGIMLPPRAPFQFNTFRGAMVKLDPEPGVPVGVEPVKEPVKEIAAGNCILPEPQEIRLRTSKEPFEINSRTRIVVSDNADEVDQWIVDEINSHIEKLGGSKLQIVRAYAMSKDPEMAHNVIIVGETARNPLLRSVCEAQEVRMPRSRYGTGAYVVDVMPSRIVLAGQSQTETFYAAQTLKQMMKAGDDGAILVPSQNIRDYPRFAFRGVHLLASKDALSFLGKLIENVLAPLKVNHIVLQTDKVVWKSHPEATDPHNNMPQEDVKKLIEIARRHHITVTPLVQSPGHLEWAFRDGNNLEFAEDPEDPYCYCMSNPKSYDFIFDIMDEAIELFGQPEYFHAGRDEFDMRGNMPVDEKCKATGKERLYIQDTLKIYEHLKAKGCKMMMWGDILTKPGFRELVDELPKDILINDWRYAPSETYPTVEFYQRHGFPVLGCTWYDPRNIYTFANFAAKRNIRGMLHTTWTGFESEEAVLSKYPEQAYAYVLAGVWMWNPLRPDMDNLPFKPRAMFEKAWREAPNKDKSSFACVRLQAYCNVSRVDSGRALGWLGVGRDNDLRALPAGIIGIGGVPYNILPASIDAPAAVMLGADGLADVFPRKVENIRIESTAKALHFLHACAQTADKEVEVARYVVKYEDGQTAEIPLIYDRNIYSWDDQSSGMSYGFAWRARGQDGRSVGVCDLMWENPHPDVPIDAIDMISANTQASPFLLAITVEN